jgi:hypothetical protein
MAVCIRVELKKERKEGGDVAMWSASEAKRRKSKVASVPGAEAEEHQRSAGYSNICT